MLSEAFQELVKVWGIKREDPAGYAEWESQNPMHEFSLLLKAVCTPEKALKLYAEARDDPQRRAEVTAAILHQVIEKIRKVRGQLVVEKDLENAAKSR